MRDWLINKLGGKTPEQVTDIVAAIQIECTDEKLELLNQHKDELEQASLHLDHSMTQAQEALLAAHRKVKKADARYEKIRDKHRELVKTFDSNRWHVKNGLRIKDGS